MSDVSDLENYSLIIVAPNGECVSSTVKVDKVLCTLATDKFAPVRMELYYAFTQALSRLEARLKDGD
ncbi:hypothetical protein [Paracoccus shanxieyensis]|uniref:hypothetical protein n=1 Tax=Paracoccus shanxieyensis TaxID=2675752 RepID=UPI0018ACE270|nr:hypothetical protein [Paracoccus shanxieyensis]